MAVGIGGLVRSPQSLTLADLKARARHEVDFTLECSGNNGTGLDFFIGGIGNARWGGARLAPLLEEAGILDEGTEVVFWGDDRGTVTIRDNSGIMWRQDRSDRARSRRRTRSDDHRAVRAQHVSRGGARSRQPALLRDERRAAASGARFPFPADRSGLVWGRQRQVADAHRGDGPSVAGRFMARDYVSIREEQRDGQTVWTFTTVSHDRLKSAPAKVTRHGNRYAIMGAAWGAPIAAVQVQIDDGPWIAATLYGPPPPRKRSSGYAWRFWTFDWGNPVSGEHRITSRAFDSDGNIQPAPDDPIVASRTTYWESNGHITRRVLIP